MLFCDSTESTLTFGREIISWRTAVHDVRLQTVLLTFFHSRVTSQEASLLQNRTKLRAEFQQCTGNTVTDCASLTGNAAAGYGADNVQLVGVFRQSQRLTNDQLQGLQTKVFVDASAIDGDSSVPGYRRTLATEFLRLPVP